MTQQNGRATPEDLAWVENEVEYFEARFGDNDHARRLRRILNSLRFPVEQQPRAWEWTTEGKDGKVWRVVTTDPQTADRWKSEEEIVGTVTPLYAVQQPDNYGKGESDE